MKNKKAEFDIWHVILILIIILAIFFGWFALTGKITLREDTDGDGLSDEKEIEIGTNVTNPNTDGDRYLDGEEVKLHKDPLKVNSANIEIFLIDKSWDWTSSLINILSSAFKLSSPNSETVIADTKVKILIKNKGDDYSQYVNYDIIYEVAGNQLRIIPSSIGRINEGEERTIIYEKQIFLKDVPDLLINSLTSLSTKWEIKVENLNYEIYN